MFKCSQILCCMTFLKAGFLTATLQNFVQVHREEAEKSLFFEPPLQNRTAGKFFCMRKKWQFSKVWLDYFTTWLNVHVSCTWNVYVSQILKQNWVVRQLHVMYNWITSFYIIFYHLHHNCRFPRISSRGMREKWIHAKDWPDYIKASKMWLRMDDGFDKVFFFWETDSTVALLRFFVLTFQMTFYTINIYFKLWLHIILFLVSYQDRNNTMQTDFTMILGPDVPAFEYYQFKSVCYFLRDGTRT